MYTRIHMEKVTPEAFKSVVESLRVSYPELIGKVQVIRTANTIDIRPVRGGVIPEDLTPEKVVEWANKPADEWQRAVEALVPA